MSTADTKNIGIKLQASGENLNTWGDPNLNNDLIVLSNLASKFNSVTINGDTTVSETNYSTSNDTEVALIKLTAGTVAAAFNYVIPSRQKRFICWNNTGYTATIKLSASSGFSLPTGRIALVSSDATDVYNVTPNYVASFTPTNNLDLVTFTAMQTAIATAGLPATAGTLLVSATDTTAGYYFQKTTTQSGTASTTQLATLGSLQISKINGGGNEQVAFSLNPPYVESFIGAATQSSQFTPSIGYDYPVNCTSAGVTVNLGGMTTPQTSQKIKLHCFGPYNAYLLGTVCVNGASQTDAFLDAGFNDVLTYTPNGWS